MADKIGDLYVVYYEQVLPTDISSNDQHLKKIFEELETLRNTLGTWVGLVYEGRDRSAYNVNDDTRSGPRYPKSMYEHKALRRANQYSYMGESYRPTLIGIDYKATGETELIMIKDLYDLEAFKKRVDKKDFIPPRLRR